MFDQTKLSTCIKKIYENSVHDLNVFIQRSIGNLCEFVQKTKYGNPMLINSSDMLSAVESKLVKSFTNQLTEKFSEFKEEFALSVSHCLLEVEKQITCLSEEYKLFATALDDFFPSKVAVDEEKMKFAKENLDTFLDTLQLYLSEKWPKFPVGEFELAGSVSDGTKVCLPNEFDIMMPIILPKGDFITYEQPTKHLLKIVINQLSHGYWEGRWNNEWISLQEPEKETYKERHISPRQLPNRVSKTSVAKNKSCLSPEMITGQIKKMLVAFKKDQNSVAKLASKNITLDYARSAHYYEFGPAIDVLVIYKCPRGKSSFVVDIVPYVQGLQGKDHVMNPCYAEFQHFSVGKGGGSGYLEVFADPTMFWRVSHSPFEARLFHRLKDKIQKPLMIWKAFALRNEHIQNAILNSFHLKNIVLLLAYENIEKIDVYLSKESNLNDEKEFFAEQTQAWANYPLALQVIEVGRMMYKFLRTGHMPWASLRVVRVNFKPSNKHVLKNHKTEDYRKSLCEYLEEVFSSNAWNRLLEDCTREVNENECPFSRKVV